MFRTLKMPRIGVVMLTIALVVAAPPAPLAGQEPARDRGLVGAGLLLRQLDGVKRVLMIGAHPDDEDTSLLSALARGHGAETAYLALTRGDGGQNLIGPELGEGLGVVRTGELVAARRLDGGLQFFTRAFDYGYSKNAEEAFGKWPREELLRDVVWVIRTFRPHVVVSVFSGTPRDGHGQHQAAGIMAREAFRAAADPDRFVDQLGRGAVPWQPAKLYRLSWFDPEAADTEVATGTFDPLLGASWFQIAMESRSQHRSQDMGAARPLGPRSSSLVLVDTAAGVTAEGGEGLFAGVDTTLVSLVEPLPEHGRLGAGRALERYRAAVREAEESLDPASPWAAAPALGRALDQLVVARGAAEQSGEAGRELLRVLDTRVGRVEEALLDAAGIVVEVRAGDDLIVPGQTVRVMVEMWNGGPFPVTAARPSLHLPEGWSADPVPVDEDDGRSRSFFFRRGGSEVVPSAAPVAVDPSSSVLWRWNVRVPPDAALSELYYLERPRDGALYRWPDRADLRGLPRQPPLVRGAVAFSVALPRFGDDVPVAVEVGRPARYVGVDPASGQFDTPVLVVPALSLQADPSVMVVPADRGEPRSVSVILQARAPDGARGELVLELPEGWTASPAARSFAIAGEGQEASFAFSVRPPADAVPGRFVLGAVATDETGRRFDLGVDLVDYPHIEREALFEPAGTRVTVVPVRVDAGLRVGYVMGSGDDVVQAIRELGVEVELLAPPDLRGGDLSRFDVLVLGVRAYETRTDLQAVNDRVLDFARAGGTVLVQYNQYQFPAGGYAPYPVSIARPHDRVTDEGSPHGFIHVDNPVFQAPNRIGPEDFEGWVTERGLYFLSEWDDERMTPLLELTDPGEEPKRGALVVAPVGEGLWIYTGLSFFRQLPAGVPGAYRLFANLLSLDAAEWRAWEEGR
jgi:LmbE family N-acetylglucosaminyl deacetylase